MFDGNHITDVREEQSNQFSDDAWTVSHYEPKVLDSNGNHIGHRVGQMVRESASSVFQNVQAERNYFLLNGVFWRLIGCIVIMAIFVRISLHFWTIPICFFPKKFFERASVSMKRAIMSDEFWSIVFIEFIFWWFEANSATLSSSFINKVYLISSTCEKSTAFLEGFDILISHF